MRYARAGFGDHAFILLGLNGTAMRRRFWIDGKPSRVGEEGCHAYHHRMRKRHRSSLMLAGKVEELCEEEGIKADVESMDLNGASSANPDLFITVKELAPELHATL